MVYGVGDKEKKFTRSTVARQTRGTRHILYEIMTKKFQRQYTRIAPYALCRVVYYMLCTYNSMVVTTINSTMETTFTIRCGIRITRDLGLSVFFNVFLN